MVLLTDLMTFLNDFMDFNDKVPHIDRYLVNGLQVAGQAEIHKIVVGVSANMRLLEAAVAAEAQAVLVHHSLNMPTSLHFEADQIFMRRMRYLWAQQLSLIGYHYLLDCHREVGNNAVIIQKLGGTLLEPYGKDGWGWVAELEGGKPLAEVIGLCRNLFHDNGFYYPVGHDRVRKVVCLSGGGPPRPNDYVWLMANEIDLFISGEVREWNQELCREAGVSMVAGGHYNTEVFGVQALGQVLMDQFEVEVAFEDVPNAV